MKPLFWFVLLFLLTSNLCHSQLSASSALSRISLDEGIVSLDKDWKFKEGDDAAWSQSSYDDRFWQTVDLGNYTSFLPAFNKKRIGWFRLKLILDSGLRNKPVSFIISQMGACEMYINGSLFIRQGEIHLPDIVVSNPHERPFLYTRDLRGDTITIAVRFASRLPTPLWLLPGRGARPLSIKMGSWLSATDNYRSFLVKPRIRIGFSFMTAGLGLLFILLYSFFPKEKINLLFGLFCLFLSTNALIEFQLSEGNLNIMQYGIISFGSMMEDKICGMLIFSIISIEILNRVTVYQRILIFYVLIIDTLLYLFFGATEVNFIWANIVRLIVTIEFIRLGLYGLKKGNYIIAVVAISSSIRNIGFILSFFTPINYAVSYDYFNWIICIAVVTFYLAAKFARHSKNQIFQLSEINILSEANLKKEQEKYEMLENLVNERKNSQQALSDVRQGIALDLHDEIGSTLNSISVYSEIAGRQLKSDLGNAEILLSKMGTASRNMIDTMNDIVWAVNPKNDSFKNILERMQYFAAELLSGKNILLQFNVDEKVIEVRLPMEIRKNFYLIFKEAIHNSYKYADGKNVYVNIAQEGQHIAMSVTDDGKGFDIGRKSLNGNGMASMAIRAKEINAQLDVRSWLSKGTRIELIIPL
jgi:signal transduction histidine kinase